MFRWPRYIGVGRRSTTEHDGRSGRQLPPAVHAARLLDDTRQLLVRLPDRDVGRLLVVHGREGRGEQQLYSAVRHQQVPRLSTELRLDARCKERQNNGRRTLRLRSTASLQRARRARSNRHRWYRLWVTRFNSGPILLSPIPQRRIYSALKAAIQ